MKNAGIFLTIAAAILVTLAMTAVPAWAANLYVDDDATKNGDVVSYTDATKVLIASAGTFTGYDLGDAVEIISGTGDKWATTIATYTSDTEVTLTDAYGSDFTDGTINCVDLDAPSSGDPFRYIQSGVDIASSGDVINVAEGIYTLSTTWLSIEKNISLIGPTSSTATIAAGADMGALIKVGTTTAVNVTIKNFTFDANGKSVEKGVQYWTNGTTGEISNNIIDMSSSTHTLPYGLYIISCDPVITNNTITGNSAGESGIRLYPAAGVDYTVTSNTISGYTTYHGIHMATGPSIPYNISNNGITNCKLGILVREGNSSATIDNNVINCSNISGSVGITQVTNCNGVTISNNTISNCNEGIVDWGTNDTIQNDNIHDNNWGITIKPSSTGAQVKECTLTNNSSVGLENRGTNSTIYNNTIYNSYEGIKSYGTNGIFQNNDIYDNTYSGITLLSSADGTTIQGCTFSSEVRGVENWGTNTTIGTTGNANIFLNCTWSALQNGSSSSNTHFDYNIVSGCNLIVQNYGDNLDANYNDFDGSNTWGLENRDDTEIDATHNWWGANDGPRDQGPGHGDKVHAYGTGGIDYSNWLSSPQNVETVIGAHCQFVDFPVTFFLQSDRSKTEVTNVIDAMYERLKEYNNNDVPPKFTAQGDLAKIFYDLTGTAYGATHTYGLTLGNTAFPPHSSGHVPYDVIGHELGHMFAIFKDGDDCFFDLVQRDENGPPYNPFLRETVAWVGSNYAFSTIRDDATHDGLTTAEWNSYNTMMTEDIDFLQSKYNEYMATRPFDVDAVLTAQALAYRIYDLTETYGADKLIRFTQLFDDIYDDYLTFNDNGVSDAEQVAYTTAAVSAAFDNNQYANFTGSTGYGMGFTIDSTLYDNLYAMLQRLFNGSITIQGESPTYDYLTIQQAIDSASSGNTINVTAGTYNENIVVNKIINLSGSGMPTISVSGTNIEVTVDNVVVTGFDITGGSTGILVNGGANNKFNYNKIHNNTTYGINNTGTDTIDAEYNYWGDASGPSGEGYGTGDSLSANIVYSPWYADQAMTTLVYESFAEIKVWLEGAYDTAGDTMRTSIHGSIPLTSPYTAAPKTVTSIPADVVDWVWVQLRSTESGATEAQRSLFLKKDGTVVYTDGTTTGIPFEAAAGDYYVIVRHRNHLGIMSGSVLTFVSSGSPNVHNFTTGSGQSYGTDAIKELETGAYGMYSGEGNNSGIVSIADVTIAIDNRDAVGYETSDYNLSNIVTVADATNSLANRDKTSKIPSQ